MFSGLGSIADLNQQFAQFTSNLTNLDSLQDGENTKKESAVTNDVVVEADAERTRQLEDQLARCKVLYDSAMGNLAVSNNEVGSQKVRIVELQQEVEELRGYLSVTTGNFEAYREQSEKRIQTLMHAQASVQLQSDSSDSPAESGDVDHPQEVIRLQGEISQCEARNADLMKDIAEHKRKAKADQKESRQLLAERDASIQRLEQQVQEFVQSLVGLEDEKSILQARAAQLEGEMQRAAEVATERDALLKRMAQLEDDAQKAVALQEDKAALAARVAALEEDLRSTASLRDEKDALATKTSRLEAAHAELERQLLQVRESAAQSGEAVSSTQQLTKRLQRDVLDAQRGAAEAEGKVATLTEKLKDMMHRFAELKTKSSAQLQQAEEKYADLTKIAQAKDSELLAFRLKTENADRSTSDLRLKASELAERYSDAQREIARLRDAAEEGAAQLAALAEERDQSVKMARALAERQDELAAEAVTTQEKVAELEGQHERMLQKLAAERAAEAESSQNAIAQLQAELALVANRLKQDAESAGSLDQYKKKAQLALKKANSTVATLTAEVQQLQASAEDAAARLLEAQDGARLAGEQCAALQRQLVDADARAAGAEGELRTLREEVEALKSEHTASTAALQAKIAELLEAAERSQQQSQSGYSALADRVLRKGSVPPAEPGFVSVGKARAAAAHEDDTASSYSAESDLAAAASSAASAASHPASSAPAPPISGGGSDGRESSWAMVASASAAGSRLSSANASSASIDGTAPRAGTAEETETPVGGREETQADVSGFATAPSADSLLFISQLQHQLEGLKKALAQRGIDLEAAHHQLQYEKDEKRALKARVEELKAFLDRSKQLHEGPDSATNMEYLKNCVFKFMSSVDASEKRRLYPVIATILKLTSQEMKQVEYAFNVTEQRENELQSTLTSIGSFATSSLGSFWDSAATTLLGGAGSGEGGAQSTQRPS